MNKLKKWVVCGVATLAIVNLMRLMLLDVYYVPTSSMAKTIQPKSYVVISKVDYGAKILNSTLRRPYLCMFLRKIVSDDYRMPGFSKIKRGDIALLEHRPTGTKLIKRVIGIPGDSVIIENGIAKINSVREELRPCYIFRFECVFDGEDIQVLDKKFSLTYKEKNVFDLTLDGQSAEEFVNNFHHRLRADPISQSDSISPASMRGSWGRDQYGQLMIPAAGTKLALDKKNLSIYKETIELYENVRIEESARGYKVNGVTANNYIFKNDYYFVLGDNRMDSKDSRFLGLFPKASVLGRVIFKE